MEQALRVVVGMPGDEMDVTAEGLFQELEGTPPQVVRRQPFHGSSEVARRLEGHPDAHLALQERKGRERRFQWFPQLAFGLVVRELRQRTRILAAPGFDAGRVQLGVEVAGQVLVVGADGGLVQATLTDRLVQPPMEEVDHLASVLQVRAELTQHVEQVAGGRLGADPLDHLQQLPLRHAASGTGQEGQHGADRVVVELLAQSLDHLAEDGRDGVALFWEGGDASFQLLERTESAELFQGHQQEQGVLRRGIGKQQAHLPGVERLGRKRGNAADDFQAFVPGERLDGHSLKWTVGQGFQNRFRAVGVVDATGDDLHSGRQLPR